MPPNIMQTNPSYASVHQHQPTSSQVCWCNQEYIETDTGLAVVTGPLEGADIAQGGPIPASTFLPLQSAVSPVQTGSSQHKVIAFIIF